MGAMRRHGAHHVAQKSTSTTPFFTSSPKLASVNVLTFSDAMRPCLPLGCRSTAAVALGRSRLCRGPRPLLPWCSPRPEPFVHFDILTGRAVPREVDAHAVLLEPRPDLLVGVRGERRAQGVEKR